MSCYIPCQSNIERNWHLHQNHWNGRVESTKCWWWVLEAMSWRIVQDKVALTVSTSSTWTVGLVLIVLTPPSCCVNINWVQQNLAFFWFLCYLLSASLLDLPPKSPWNKLCMEQKHSCPFTTLYDKSPCYLLIISHLQKYLSYYFSLLKYVDYQNKSSWTVGNGDSPMGSLSVVLMYCRWYGYFEKYHHGGRHSTAQFYLPHKDK